MKDNTPGYISAKEWPPYSSDLNVMKCSIWRELEGRVRDQKYDKLADVKTAFIREWEQIPQNVYRKAHDSFLAKLKEIVKDKG